VLDADRALDDRPIDITVGLSVPERAAASR
jgi:hypothetical protein